MPRGQAEVSSPPPLWTGRDLALGSPEVEHVTLDASGRPAGAVDVGDTVSLHWDWVCDKLTDRQLRALRGYSQRHLDMVNHRVDHPGTVAALG